MRWKFFYDASVYTYEVSRHLDENWLTSILLKSTLFTFWDNQNYCFLVFVMLTYDNGDFKIEIYSDRNNIFQFYKKFWKLHDLFYSEWQYNSFPNSKFVESLKD